MPTFAILGATGQVGGAILTEVVKDNTAEVRCLVRSRKKLYKQNPQLETNPRITAIEGSISDLDALIECIEPCSAVFSCTAPTGNPPGCSVALDTAHSIVAALTNIRLAKKSIAPLPKILMLSSATINDHLSRDLNPTFRWILHTGLRHVYDDLERAEAYYRLHQSWLSVVFMQPGGLVRQEAVGYTISTDKQYTFLPIPDLASAIVEVAGKQDGELEWKNVSVVAIGKTRFEPDALKAITMGWVWSAFPWLYFICQKAGLF